MFFNFRFTNKNYPLEGSKTKLFLIYKPGRMRRRISSWSWTDILESSFSSGRKPESWHFLQGRQCGEIWKHSSSLFALLRSAYSESCPTEGAFQRFSNKENQGFQRVFIVYTLINITKSLYSQINKIRDLKIFSRAISSSISMNSGNMSGLQ